MFISFLIITRNRTDELKNVLQSISSCAAESSHAYEIIIVDNGSEAMQLKIIRELVAEFPQARLIENGSNLGVAGGRNVALRAARGDILIELDDDAVLVSKDAIHIIAETFNRDQAIGILAFKIVDYDRKAVESKEYPFFNKWRGQDICGESAWFIGCGHAFKRKLVDEVGLYGDFYPYGAEELDYSLRSIDKGYKIWYTPQITVLHKKAVSGRWNFKREFPPMALKHRLKAVSLNLPWICLLSHWLIRGSVFAFKYRSASIPFKAISLLWQEREYIYAHRRQVSWATVLRLLRLRGQLFF